ncbi:hypothetical protein ES705_30985 [subsurface metagenome]
MAHVNVVFKFSSTQLTLKLDLTNYKVLAIKQLNLGIVYKFAETENRKQRTLNHDVMIRTSFREIIPGLDTEQYSRI